MCNRPFDSRSHPSRVRAVWPARLFDIREPGSGTACSSPRFESRSAIADSSRTFAVVRSWAGENTARDASRCNALVRTGCDQRRHSIGTGVNGTYIGIPAGRTTVNRWKSGFGLSSETCGTPITQSSRQQVRSEVQRLTSTLEPFRTVRGITLGTTEPMIRCDTCYWTRISRGPND